jgi:tRNA nucleotidyltransferase (CCA-adding enzyme)
LTQLPPLRQQLPFDLIWLPSQAYLVGGAVRDAILGRRREYLDWDFVIPEKAVETARAIAEHYQAGFVVLDKARQIARVVFPQGTVDFALQEGQTLEQDLQRRDFTINAIAYNLHQKRLIDPLNGVKDLKKRLLKMVSARNLADDPLRLLRAYRQAAQLQFAIDPTTRETIQDLARLIKGVAAERVQSELNYLLSSPRGNQWLLAAWQDGLLKVWFPQVDLDTLNIICRIDLALATVKATLSVEERLVFAQALGKKSMATAKLASLVTRDLLQAEIQLETLKYSRQEIRAVCSVLKGYVWLTQISSLPSLREQYFFFLEMGKYLPILILFALANGSEQSLIFELLAKYLDPQNAVAHPRALISGNDLIQKLKLKPSPIIGKLLTEIQVAHIEGKVASVQEALIYGEFLIQNQTSLF